MSTFQGHFHPPDMGRTTVPIAIVGEGSIDVGGDELVVRGIKRAGAAGLIALMVLGVLALMIPLSMLLSSFGWSTKTIGRADALIGFSLAFGGLAFIRRHQAARSKDPLELKFPWKQVRKGDHDPEQQGVVLIHVKRSIFNTESLHFAPADGPHALIAELKERIAK